MIGPHLILAHTASQNLAEQRCQKEKSGWLVEVSACLGVGLSERARLVTPPDMEMEEA